MTNLWEVAKGNSEECRIDLALHLQTPWSIADFSYWTLYPKDSASKTVMPVRLFIGVGSQISFESEA